MRADKHTKPSGSAAKRVLKGVGKVLGTMVLVLTRSTRMGTTGWNICRGFAWR